MEKNYFRGMMTLMREDSRLEWIFKLKMTKSDSFLRDEVFNPGCFGGNDLKLLLFRT